MRKFIYILLGFVFVGIGAIGAILPVLPTTPFLLLALFFFSKGSKKFENWFRGTKLFKNYLEEFVEHRTMELKTKVMLLSFASTVLLTSAYLVKSSAFRILIAFLMVYKYYYFTFKIKTIRSEVKGEVYIAETKNPA